MTNTRWTHDEEMALAYAWNEIELSGDKNRRWERIKELFHISLGRTEHYRTTDMLTGKWRDIRLKCENFNRIYAVNMNERLFEVNQAHARQARQACQARMAEEREESDYEEPLFNPRLQRSQQRARQQHQSRVARRAQQAQEAGPSRPRLTIADLEPADVQRVLDKTLQDYNTQHGTFHYLDVWAIVKDNV